MVIVTKAQAEVFLDGGEVCRKYITTDQITFGTSTLRPGQTGGIDPGHPVGHEVFFVSSGTVLMHNTASGKYYELHEQDTILVEKGEPHELTNIGTEPAVISWSMAPSQTD